MLHWYVPMNVEKKLYIGRKVVEVKDIKFYPLELYCMPSGNQVPALWKTGIHKYKYHVNINLYQHGSFLRASTASRHYQTF